MFLEFYATVPGLDAFVTMEKSQRIRNFLEVYNIKKNINKLINIENMLSEMN